MLTLHLSLVVLTLLLIVYSDYTASAWLLGKKETLTKEHIRVVHLVVTYGLALIILTGGLMFIERSEYLLKNSLFLKKMFFVLALVINGFFIGSFSKLATEQSFTSLSRSQKTMIIVLAGISTLSWLSAVTLGFLL